MKRLSLGILALTATACLENEEEILIRADGSARVVVTARGDLPDLAGGYPVPLASPWSPRTEDAERWIRELGPDTGSVAVRRRLAEITWSTAPKDEQEAELVAARELASVDEWPRWFAPENEPYRTAFLERSAKLEIIDRGDVKIYVFERVYHGVDHGRLDVSQREEAELAGVWEKLDELDPFSAEEWTQIRDTLARINADVAELYVRDALVGVFTEGNASLSPHAVPTMLNTLRRAVDELITLDDLRRLNHLIYAEREEEVGVLLEDYERDYRDTMRRVLEETLAGEGVDEPTINAVSFALEWIFTAFDNYADLADEEFAVTVEMPGVLIGGNFESSSGSVAEWSFDGEKLRNGDVVMRAVSVLE